MLFFRFRFGARGSVLSLEKGRKGSARCAGFPSIAPLPDPLVARDCFSDIGGDDPLSAHAFSLACW